MNREPAKNAIFPSPLVAASLLSTMLLAACTSSGDGSERAEPPADANAVEESEVANEEANADPKPVPCAAAAYAATQKGNVVTLVAEGEHPTGGWTTELVQQPQRIFPPQFALVCTPPAGPATQVISPYRATASFQSRQAVREVILFDKKGRQVVPVKQEE